MKEDAMPKLNMHINDRIEMLQRDYRAWERLYERRQEARDAINWDMMTTADQHAATEYDERINDTGAWIWCELDHLERDRAEVLW
jgi:hypothetical protein